MKRNVNVNIMQYELRKKQFKCNQQGNRKKNLMKAGYMRVLTVAKYEY